MTTPEKNLAALGQRLEAASTVLLDHIGNAPADPATRTSVLLVDLVTHVRTTLSPADAWLLWVAASGYLPLSDDVDELLRQFELAATSTDAEIWLLHRAREIIEELGAMTRPMRVVRDAVVVDVSFSAQFDKHTGIQRVTREVCSRWQAEHEVELVAWIPSHRGLRSLTVDEEARVVAWSDAARGTASESSQRALPDDAELVVPWGTTVVLPEVAQGTSAQPLAALAQHSGNVVVAIGYDAIPVVSADLRPVSEPNQFVGYLTVIKHTTRVAGISTSAAAEFRGFADAVRAQGLPGPQVVEVMLAAEVPSNDKPDTGAALPGGVDAPEEGSPARPLVLCVGSHELHKNHVAVLHAAELLWRDGLDFELRFVGGRGWDTEELDELVESLTAAGRSVTKVGSVTDEQLWSMYRSAAFTVFPSLHEGFGLPVAESLACGTPAVTTRYGSTEEISRRGGCLLVNPRDDHEVSAAMRRLLTEPDLLAELSAAARSSVGRSWDQYADEVWDYLVLGLGAR